MNTFDVGKRMLDVLGALLGIVVFSPLMIGAAIWIKLVSPGGPILADIPMRIGKNNKLFRFYKFRSMIPNAHEWVKQRPEMWKQYVKNNYKLDPDPRLIKGAKFLRKSSIDEMPQFFNVLLGNMSLVGPRAYYSFEAEEQLKKYPYVRDQMDIALSVKPGITGLWQVSGRSELNFDERVKLDAKYAGKKSLMYDLMIIVKTPYVVLTGKGAY
jgi:lipopolysaccharide/colanic/teichoic acid biosynthesis glycosyltransferase